MKRCTSCSCREKKLYTLYGAGFMEKGSLKLLFHAAAALVIHQAKAFHCKVCEPRASGASTDKNMRETQTHGNKNNIST